jgi:hypothetical protein
MNPGLIKNYTGQGAIGAMRIVKAGSADGTVAQAAASTDPILGISSGAVTMSYDDGDPVDVIHRDIADLQLGGNVAYGNYLTSDPNGCGIVAAPAAGVNCQVVAKALESGISGDIIRVLITLTQIQG